MKHKKLSAYVPGAWDEAIAARLRDDLHWYNATAYSHLTVALHLPREVLRHWPTVERIVAVFREGKAAQRSDPQFRFFVDPAAGPEVYARLERLDTRLPRFSVCPVVPVVPGASTAAALREHLRRLGDTIAGRILDIRLAYLPASIDALDSLTDTLLTAREWPMVTGYPIVELDFAAPGDGAAIEAAVARFIETHPTAVESINMSPGSYVRRLHQLKEAWYLGHITGRPLEVAPPEPAHDAPTRERIRDFDDAFHRRHATLDWYNKARHKQASVILEFDLDSIADTYECQSPVFSDGRWILDRDRLAGQIDPVTRVAPGAASTAAPRAASGPAVAAPPPDTPAPATLAGPGGRRVIPIHRPTEVVLLKMPNHNMDYPHLAIPTITAALRNKHYQVVQQDVNVQLRDVLLSAASLREITHAFLPALAQAFLDSPADLERIRNAIAYLLYVEDNVGFDTIERIKRRMQARDYDALLTDPCDASTVSLVFVLTGMMHIVIDLGLTADETGIEIDNPVVRFLQAKVREVASLRPRIVGFSVIQIQRKATLWFARRLKAIWNGMIVVGGPDPSTFKEEYLCGHPYIDAGFLKEAEHAFIKFLEGTPPAQIPGIVYRGDDGVIRTNEPAFERSGAVFQPDFDGFDLDCFLLPTLPMSTSRGCHFGKCTFCNHHKTYSGYYSNDASRTVDTMEYLSRRHGTRFFHFVDDMLEVESGTAIADELIRRGLDYNIITYARFEAHFQQDPTVLQRWHQAGIRVIEWGLESASQRVLNMMVKGVAVRHVQNILDISAGAGIVNKLMLFHNYPGEMVDDLKMTVDFLRTNVIARKVRPFFTVRGRYELRLYTPLEIDSRSPDKNPFRKRYERSSSFDSLLGYATDDDYREKSDYIEAFIDEMAGYLLERRIFSTNDENMSMDLIVRDMQARGLQPAFHTQ